MDLRQIYGHDMIMRPFMGNMMWMRRDMCIPFHHFAIQHALRQHLSFDLDVVFEIGSGMGDGIAELAAHNPFPHIRFYGGDIALEGQACIREFADLLNLQTLHGLDFNILNPDFSFLKGKKSALVFSQFALAYVNPFPEAFFHRLLDAVNEVKVILFEPFSFELVDEAPELKPVFTRERAKHYGICGNLWSTIRALQQSGYIDIDELIPDFAGKTTFSAISLARFHKR
jgi:hypothetical protein